MLIKSQNRQMTYSLTALIISNMIPIFGVLFFDWSLFMIMFLYWAESGVIGFYNVLKMLRIGGIESIILVPFFAVHFGGFMSGHLFFIVFIFGFDNLFLNNGEININDIFNIPNFLGIIIPIFSLFISHGISFFYNFLKNKEYNHTNISQQMFMPYKRIVIMHITIIGSGFLSILLGNSSFAIILLVIFKICADIKSHITEHTRGEHNTILSDI